MYEVCTKKLNNVKLNSAWKYKMVLACVEASFIFLSKCIWIYDFSEVIKEGSELVYTFVQGLFTNLFLCFISNIIFFSCKWFRQNSTNLAKFFLNCSKCWLNIRKVVWHKDLDVGRKTISKTLSSDQTVHKNLEFGEILVMIK